MVSEMRRLYGGGLVFTNGLADVAESESSKWKGGCGEREVNQKQAGMIGSL